MISGLLGLLINNGFSKTFNNDSIQVPDSLKISGDSSNTIIKTKSSPNAPETIVKYFARDSIVMDNIKNVVYLYSEAKVEYGEMIVNADTIIIYLDKNEVYAKGGLDSLGKRKKVHFQDGDQSFDAPEMAYNFDSKKGRIYDIVTEESEMYLHAKIAKRSPSEDIYVQKGKITTCDAEDPHFYFEAEKLKVKPGKYIVVGPTHLVIRNVHTPLWVPFGIFPNNATRQSGILIPGPASDRGQQGLRELGYHWAINDYVHATLLTDVFFSGLFRANLRFDYKRLYKYNGELALNYNRNPSGIVGLSNFSTTEDYEFIWKYNQDSKANPKTRFNVNITARTATFNKTQNQNITTSYNSVQSYNRSNVSWGLNESWGSFQSTADFNQDFARKQITMKAPNLNLRFNNKRIIGNLQFRTTIDARNEVTSGDSTFFQQDIFTKMNNGGRINTVFDFGKSYRVLKYINMTLPSLTVNGYVNYKTIRQTSTSKGIVRDTVPELRGAYDMSLGNFRFNTKIFGTYTFKEGMYVKGLRHTIDPTVSLTWNPDFFIDAQDVNRILRDSIGENIGEYSIYQNSMYRPTASRALSANFSLNNVLQGKVKEKKDSTYSYKKINIIQALNATSRYNFLADSLKWDDIRLNLNANPGFLKNFNIDAVINPYEKDSLGNSVNRLLWKKNQIGRLVNFNIRSTAGISRKTFIPKQFRESVLKDGFNWTMNISYTFSYRKPNEEVTLNNSLETNGNVEFNNKWGFSYRLPIDIETFNISQNTSLSFRRDLHCWEMTVDWLPFNNNVNYTFTIRPKAGMLSDLKYEKRNQGNTSLFDQLN